MGNSSCATGHIRIGGNINIIVLLAIIKGVLPIYWQLQANIPFDQILSSLSNCLRSTDEV